MTEKLVVTTNGARKIKKTKQKLLFIGVALTGVLLFLLVITCLLIGSDVKKQCQEAKREYGDDCVEALIRLVNDEKKDFRTRNSAIWALGQLGDRRALSTLQKYYTSNIPPKESLFKTISQYELKKAIELTSGGFNLTAIFWRNGVLNGK